MQSVEFYSPKGGVGTTTTAGLYAVLRASQGVPTHLLASNEDDTDLATVCGFSAYGSAEGWATLLTNLTWGVKVPPATELVVTDYRIPEFAPAWHHLEAVNRVLVVRNCFLALRRTLADQHRPDAVVAVLEAGRALTVDDIRDCIGCDTVIAMPIDPSIARAVDAGLLATRLPRAAARVFGRTPIPIKETTKP